MYVAEISASHFSALWGNHFRYATIKSLALTFPVLQSTVCLWFVLFKMKSLFPILQIYIAIAVSHLLLPLFGVSCFAPGDA